MILIYINFAGDNIWMQNKLKQHLAYEVKVHELTSNFIPFISDLLLELNKWYCSGAWIIVSLDTTYSPKAQSAHEIWKQNKTKNLNYKLLTQGVYGVFFKDVGNMHASLSKAEFLKLRIIFHGWYLNLKCWLRVTHGTIPPYPIGFYLKQYKRFSGWILLFVVVQSCFHRSKSPINQFHRPSVCL